MLTVGDTFPEYELTGLKGGPIGSLGDDPFATWTHKDALGGWAVYFAWPKDFTFVCPTEIAAFGRLTEEFAERDARVLGFSVDSEFVHHAWRRDHPDLRELPFPMLADVRRELTAALGVLGEDGVARRATFLVDPDGEIQFSMVTAGSVGRNPKEVLRVLDALQTDELCPCNWKKGDATLDAAALLTGA
jgi:peroxiredoxin (alkyl hydroperoxide reductase subunit C)